MAVSDSTRRQRESWIKQIRTPGADLTGVVDQIKRSIEYGGVDDRLRDAVSKAVYSGFSYPSLQLLASVARSMGIRAGDVIDYRGAIQIDGLWHIYTDIRDVLAIVNNNEGISFADAAIACTVAEPNNIRLFSSIKDVEERVCLGS